MQDVALSAEGLAKRYGSREVVSDISFALHPGEVFGFLGPNGAGKTTTIRMLVGLVRPTRGRVVIGGHVLSEDFEAAMRKVGCIVETPALYTFLTGRENLEHFARMLGKDAWNRIGEVARLVHMEERLGDLVRSYSLGMRQRIGIAQALLGNLPSSSSTSRRTASTRRAFARCASCCERLLGSTASRSRVEPSPLGGREAVRPRGDRAPGADPRDGPPERPDQQWSPLSRGSLPRTDRRGNGMRLLAGLLENETLKVLRRKRFRLVLIVLFGILVLIAFAQSRNQAFAKKNAGADWRPGVARRVANLDTQSASGRAPEAFVRMMKFEAARLRYHLSHDVRPDVLTGPAFCRAFAGSGSVLLLPLLVAIFASDLVSAELSEGTLPLLLTRPVSRWKILSRSSSPWRSSPP
jgi:ABC-type transport system involved in cytochrome c biogenesis ATPase subunit